MRPRIKSHWWFGLEKSGGMAKCCAKAKMLITRGSDLAISLGGRSLESTICFRPSNSVLNVWNSVADV